jgi:P-type E1-E2 ATPase
VTVGAPTVTTIEPVDGESEAHVLELAAACGFGSLHPVSRAVVAEAQARALDVSRPVNVQEKPGLGVVATVGGHLAALGRKALLVEQGIEIPMSPDEDVSHVWVASDGRCIGRLVLRDRPRSEARTALAVMRSLGMSRLILLTGDREKTALEIGRALDMDQVVAEVLPAQKLDVVRAEQAAGHTVMMVGDGVNDAPALGGADVGVAIGAELNEVALGGADVAVLGTDLRRLPQLIGLADMTRAVIGQNVWLAFALSIGLIVLAARGILDPLTGALAQSTAVFAVVANSARILRFAAPSAAVPVPAIDYPLRPLDDVETMPPGF